MKETAWYLLTVHRITGIIHRRITSFFTQSVIHSRCIITVLTVLLGLLAYVRQGVYI